MRFRQTQRVLEQSLLCALVAVAVDADDNGSPKPPCPSRQHVVDAAKAYMRDHIDRPITVADLCVELGVSRRTLQYSFQQVLGLNPVRYLRALRLNGVGATSRPSRPARFGARHRGAMGVLARGPFRHRLQADVQRAAVGNAAPQGPTRARPVAFRAPRGDADGAPGLPVFCLISHKYRRFSRS